MKEIIREVTMKIVAAILASSSRDDAYKRYSWFLDMFEEEQLKKAIERVKK